MTKSLVRKQAHPRQQEHLTIPIPIDVPLTAKKYDWTLHDKKWLIQVTKQFPRSAKALGKVLKDGASAGLERDYLLFLLHQYCKSADEVSIVTRREAAGFAVRNARQMLDSCEELMRSLVKAQADPLTRNLATLAASPRIGLATSLNRYTDVLRFQILADERVATKKSSGLDDWWLFLLAAEIKRATGQPHLGEIAALVEAGLMALDLEQSRGVGLSRRDLVARLKRFESRFPHQAGTISSLTLPG